MLCLLAATGAWSQETSQGAREERVAREAYAKLSYLCELKVVSDFALPNYNVEEADTSEVAQKIDDARPLFTITDFHSGPLAEIANKRWLNYYNPFNLPAEILHVDVNVQGFSDSNASEEVWNMGKAYCAPPPSRTLPPPRSSTGRRSSR